MASATVKRQRKRKRIDEDGEPEFQVAPMVDVLLVLLLFFMSITSTEVLKKDKNLQLPDAKNAKRPEPGDKQHEITVNIGWDGINSVAKFSMDGVHYATAQDLQGVLAGLVQKDPRDHVVIRADKDVQYSNVADLMGVCAAAGIGSVSFAALIGAPEKPGAQPPAAAH
jgi:biopolymer transport protein ExbD